MNETTIFKFLVCLLCRLELIWGSASAQSFSGLLHQGPKHSGRLHPGNVENVNGVCWQPATPAHKLSQFGLPLLGHVITCPAVELTSASLL